MSNSPIVIDTDGHTFTDAPNIISNLGDFYLSRVITTSVDDELVTARCIESMLQVSDGERRICGGLREIVSMRALAVGKEVVFRSLFPIQPPQPQPTFAAIGNPGVLTFLAKHQRGVIRHHMNDDEKQIVLDIANGFSQSQICIVGSRYDKLASIRKFLTRHQIKSTLLGRAVKRLDDAIRDVPGIVFSSFGAIDSDYVTKADVILFVDAAEIVHKNAVHLLAWQPDLRPALYGFLSQNRRLSVHEEDAITAAYGLRQLWVPLPGQRRRELNVAWVPWHSGARVNCSTGAEVQIDLTADDQRNRLVARVSHAIGHGEIPKGRDMGAIRAWMETHGRPLLNVVVLAGTSQQAMELARRLPGWAVRTLIDPSGTLASRLHASDRERLIAGQRRWNRGDTHCLVATTAVMGNLGPTKPDVIIWAGASPKLPNFPAEWMVDSADDSRPMLIVDFNDQLTADLRKATRKRANAYAALDIFSVGTSALHGRYDRFEQRQRRYARIRRK